MPKPLEIAGNVIGIFDSGCGGISFLNEAKHVLPNYKFIYLADFANAPYGTKSQNEILNLTIACGRMLYKKGVCAIVMACNTATTLGVVKLREELNIPIISMEPAIKPALENTDKKILCLATQATVRQDRYLKLVERLNAQNRVISLGASSLVEIVDSGNIKQEDVADAMDEILSGCDIRGIGAVVLGCTHFIFLKDEISNYLSDKFGLTLPFYDGNLGTARQLKRVLRERNLYTPMGNGQVEFHSTNGKIDLLKKYFKQWKIENEK